MVEMVTGVELTSLIRVKMGLFFQTIWEKCFRRWPVRPSCWKRPSELKRRIPWK